MLDEYLDNKLNDAFELIQNDTDKAIIIFNEILEIEPENVDALNGKGSALMKLNKFNEAEIYFDKSLTIKENSTALINKGIILKNKKEYKKAIECYNKAVHTNIKMKGIVNILKNEICEILNDNEDSEFTCEANALIKKGIEYKNEGRLWDALDCYSESVSKDPICEDFALSLIKEINLIVQKEFLFKAPKFKNTKIDNLKLQSLRALLIEEDPKKALKLTEIILEHDKNDIDTLNQKGYILFGFDEYDEAIRYFDRCLKINSRYHYALFNKALTLRRVNRLESALECFDELLKIRKCETKVKPYQLEILDKLHTRKLNSD